MLLQVVEQILTLLSNPIILLQLMILTDMGIKKDVPIVLNSISYEDDYQG